jgi:hypothetical protein
MRIIDRDALKHNVKEMINTLEYDSMRSAGKTKMNAQTLVNLHALIDIYNKQNSKAIPKKKEVSIDE